MKMRVLVLTLVAAFGLAACDPHDWDDPNRGNPTVSEDPQLVDENGITDNSVQESLNSDPAMCSAKGGEIMPVCMMQNPMCVITFEDAGKSCSDGSECMSGRCYGDMSGDFGADAVGLCAKTNNPCGCFQRIEDGKATPALCVD